LFVRSGLLVACLFAVAQLNAAVFSVDAVKAAFLFRFASYVQWPDEAFATGRFVIGVIDADPVAEQLERLLPGMNVRGLPAELRRVAKLSDLDGLHILYVGPGDAADTRTLRAQAASLPILMVTDRDDGFATGGVINFVEVNRNVRFEVSLVAADRARLSIDSALLAVAARVERRPQEKP
jgi:hypothetical protein